MGESASYKLLKTQDVSDIAKINLRTQFKMLVFLVLWTCKSN